MGGRRAWAWNFAGWVLFLVSAALFIVAGVRSGDSLALFGGLFFFIACVVFMVPLLAARERAGVRKK